MDKNRSFYQLGSVAGPVIQATGRLELRRLEAYWFANTKWTYLVYVRYMVSKVTTLDKIPYRDAIYDEREIGLPSARAHSILFFLQFWRVFFLFEISNFYFLYFFVILSPKNQIIDLACFWTKLPQCGK